MGVRPAVRRRRGKGSAGLHALDHGPRLQMALTKVLNDSPVPTFLGTLPTAPVVPAPCIASCLENAPEDARAHA